MFWKLFKDKSNLMELDEAGLLSAIWILASNDQNPIMTYRYIKLRLDLPENYDVKKLIQKRSELFRPGVPSWRLDEWKAKLLSPGASLPAWVRVIGSEDERKEAIESLTTEDIFRSQFRTKKDAPQSPIELIDWGLQHIERLRKAKVEENEVRWKWLREGLIPSLSVIVALGTVAITFYFQSENIQVQKELKEADLNAKQYELSFKPKQEGYTHFMHAVGTSFDIATKNSSSKTKDSNKLLEEFRKLELAYFEIEPFLSKESKELIWRELSSYGVHLTRIDNPSSFGLTNEQKEEKVQEATKIASFFREKLVKDLFDQTLSTK